MAIHVHILQVILLASSAVAELWQQEIGSNMDFGSAVSEAAASGFRRVHLTCDSKAIQVDVETEEDFSGVIYTRGSFHKRKPPCFMDPLGGKSFSLRFPLDQCRTSRENDVYSNVVVIQYDDELIMPGDVAFTVECDFRPRDVTVSAGLSAGDRSHLVASSSSISLADPDPAGKELPRHRRSTVTDDSPSVSFTPSDVRPRPGGARRGKGGGGQDGAGSPAAPSKDEL
ncbi:uncharacterized protein [Hetaerina americana]|uniref:uncharacterized protein n=1 Tax=Hetaerina americana TaxID=62018 RepID=UPI003A7F1F38